MKKLSILLVLVLLTSVLSFAAAIDGKWKSEMKRPGRDGGEITITMVFDLKSDGAKLTGSINMSTPMGERSMEISNGKLDGTKFSFTTTFDGPNGSMTTKYEGTVEGDTLKGTTTRDGGPGAGQARPFEAKKQ